MMFHRSLMFVVLFHSFQEIRGWSDGSVRRFAMAWIPESFGITQVGRVEVQRISISDY